MNFYRNISKENAAVHESPSRYSIMKPLLLLLLVIGIFLIMSSGAHAAMSLTAFPASPDTDTQIRLDWSSVSATEGYRLKWRDDANTFSDQVDIIVDTTLDPLTYTVTGLVAQTTYHFTIEAYSDEGLTAKLDEQTAPATTTAIISPYNVQAVYDINTRRAILTWSTSALTTDCSISRYDIDGMLINELPADSINGSSIVETGSDFIIYTVKATGAPGQESPPSEEVEILPIQAPFLETQRLGGSVRIYSDTDTLLPLFSLHRSKWNNATSTWGAWEEISNSFYYGQYYDYYTSGGSYRYRLESEDDRYIGYSNITGTVNGLGRPLNLTLRVSGAGSIDLEWTNAPGNDADTKIYRAFGSGYEEIATVGSNVESYTDMVTVLPGTAYHYFVMAYESADNSSAERAASIIPALPAAPTALKADLSSTAGITLTWTDNANNEDEFVIQRMTNPGTYADLTPTVAAKTGTGGTVTFLDEDLTPGNTYIYRVCSSNALGSSAYSNEVTVSSWDTVAPASLTVTPVSSNRMDLAWSYTGTLTYNTVIERKVGTTGSWATIYTAPRGVLKYSDTGLSPNTQYFYRIRKSLGPNATGISFPNNEIGKGAYTMLGNLSLSGDAVSGNTIRLSWSGNTFADVIIERKMANGSFSVITTVNTYTNSWYDNTGLVPGASYTYRVKTQTAANESLYSNEFTVQNFYLEEPSSLSATVDTESTITLNWTDNSRDETGFEIWRYVYGTSEYTLYATVGQNITSFTDTKVSKGIQYSYKVRAYIAADSYYSPFSGIASTGVGLISPPSNLSYTYVSNKTVILNWKDNSEKESGFKIERRVGTDGEWTVVYSVSRNDTSYTAYNLNPDIEYYFRVRAYTYSENADAVSEEILVSTALPIAPSNVLAQSVSVSQVKITWQDNSDNEKGFRVLRRPSTSSTYTSVATVLSNATIYYDNTVVYGNRYYYKVAAYNDTGSSESPVAEVRTSTKSNFTDLGRVSWAKDAIESLAGLGIIKGVSNNSYAPDRTISKAEFTTIVVRAFKLETAPIGALADVKSNKWYYKDVMIAENLGVIAGDDNNRFYPEVAITREEICVMLFNALQASGRNFTIHDNSELEKFIDRNNISSAAVSSMATLAGEGVIEGLPGNIIGPKYTATRAQAAVFLYRILSKISE